MAVRKVVVKSVVGTDRLGDEEAEHGRVCGSSFLAGPSWHSNGHNHANTSAHTFSTTYIHTCWQTPTYIIHGNEVCSFALSSSFAYVSHREEDSTPAPQSRTSTRWKTARALPLVLWSVRLLERLHLKNNCHQRTSSQSNRIDSSLSSSSPETSTLSSISLPICHQRTIRLLLHYHKP